MTPNPTLEAAVRRAERRLAAGTIARHRWRVTLADGREAVCAWMALGGEPDDYRACAALGISEALAHLIPWLDRAAAADRLASAILDALEARIVAREATA